MTKNLIETVLISNKDYKALLQERDELNQENKANEKQIELDVEHMCRLNEQIEKLEQENKRLKEEKQAIKSYLGIESKTILERLEELDEWKHNDKLLLWKYKSALEEIRDYLNTLSSVDSDFINTETYLRIQDKIKEVLNG